MPFCPCSCPAFSIQVVQLSFPRPYEMRNRSHPDSSCIDLFRLSAHQADEGRRARASPCVFWWKLLLVIQVISISPFFRSRSYLLMRQPRSALDGWVPSFVHEAGHPPWCSKTHEWRERCRGWGYSSIDGGTTAQKSRELKNLDWDSRSLTFLSTAQAILNHLNNVSSLICFQVMALYLSKNLCRISPLKAHFQKSQTLFSHLCELIICNLITYNTLRSINFGGYSWKRWDFRWITGSMSE